MFNIRQSENLAKMKRVKIWGKNQIVLVSQNLILTENLVKMKRVKIREKLGFFRVMESENIVKMKRGIGVKLLHSIYPKLAFGHNIFA